MIEAQQADVQHSDIGMFADWQVDGQRCRFEECGDEQPVQEQRQ